MSFEEFLLEEVVPRYASDPFQLSKDLSQRFDSQKKSWSKYDGNISPPVTARRLVERCIQWLEKTDKPRNKLDRIKILAIYRIGRVAMDVYSDGLSNGRSFGFLEGKYKYEHSVFL